MFPIPHFFPPLAYLPGIDNWSHYFLVYPSCTLFVDEQVHVYFLVPSSFLCEGWHTLLHFAVFYFVVLEIAPWQFIQLTLFHSCVVFHCVAVLWFIHLLSCVGCFQGVSIINDAAVSILVHMRVLIIGWVSSGWIPRKRVAELKSTYVCFPSWERIPICISSNNVWGFLFPSRMCYVILKTFACLIDRWEIVSKCCSTLLC